MKRIVYWAAATSMLCPSLVLAQSTVSTCEAVTYEAEEMFQSTGGPTTDGWNIWTNGYISTSHVFGGESTVITVRARGQSAGGIAPNMVVTIGGNTVFAASVTNVEWSEYTFITAPNEGSQNVRVHFTNDYYQAGQDRNLFVESVKIGSSDGWKDLTLKNDWREDENSCAPGVKLINDVITFRGGLDGSDATSTGAFCLSPSVNGGPDYTEFHTVDLGSISMRVAMEGGALGGMVLTPPNPIDPFDSYCGIIRQDDGPAPGPAARAFTSLEGVSYDRTTDDAMGVIQHPEWTRVPYAWRGHDSTQHEGSRVYAKIVDGFVRLQGIASTDYTTAGALMFTLPDPSMFPDAPVTVPVVLSPQDDQTAATAAIMTNGDVLVIGPLDVAAGDLTGTSFDSVAFSVSSPSDAQPITLESSWIQENSRPVQARFDEGVVRLEGAVTAGSSPTIGTLPVGMRPEKTVFLPVTSYLFGIQSTLSIDPSGTMTIIDPDGEMTLIGLSLDGVAFSAHGSFACTGACLFATPLTRFENSLSFGTTGERWFVVSESINGWQASEMQGRNITVNGVPVSAGQMPLPPAVGGSYYFHFSAGANDWSSWSFW